MMYIICHVSSHVAQNIVLFCPRVLGIAICTLIFSFFNLNVNFNLALIFVCFFFLTSFTVSPISNSTVFTRVSVDLLQPKN